MLSFNRIKITVTKIIHFMMYICLKGERRRSWGQSYSSSAFISYYSFFIGEDLAKINVTGEKDRRLSRGRAPRTMEHDIIAGYTYRMSCGAASSRWQVAPISRAFVWIPIAMWLTVSQIRQMSTQPNDPAHLHIQCLYSAQPISFPDNSCVDTLTGWNVRVSRQQGHSSWWSYPKDIWYTEVPVRNTRNSSHFFAWKYVIRIFDDDFEYFWGDNWIFFRVFWGWITKILKSSSKYF